MNAYSVYPPTLQAATPVEAVMAVLPRGSPCTTRRSRADFPHPAAPVKRTDCPLCTASSTRVYSSVCTQPEPDPDPEPDAAEPPLNVIPDPSSHP